MIHVDFDPNRIEGPLKAEWETLQAKARSATLKAIDDWERAKASDPESKPKLTWQNTVWTEIKKWVLKNVFNEKCAYCETPMNRFSFDAEHHRPKGGVEFRYLGEDTLQTPLVEDERGEQIGHPGYFWLAYNWRNLVPSCEFCNSGKGKNKQFPIRRQYVFVKRLNRADVGRLREKPCVSSRWPNFYYLQPDDLDELEEPLLLHPYVHHPEKHLCFGYAGIEAAKSAEGKHSIAVYNLKDDRLRRFRQDAQFSAWQRFMMAFNYKLTSERLSPEASRDAAWETVSDIKVGKTAYSAAARDWLEICCKTLGSV